jgi:solute carrier family 13 (sodium-dependent dicarboxylate transporter), member 2/3/5
MKKPIGDRTNHVWRINMHAWRSVPRELIIIVLMIGGCVLLMAMPTPLDLSPAGQRVLAVTVLAIGLWFTEVIPAGVTGILVVTALVISHGVPGFREGLSGFADPVAYFLIGVLSIGLAVLRSGLAERVARFFLRRSRGRSQALYLQMLLAFPLLTFLLPSATTRTGILVFVYEQALDLSRVPRGAPVAKAIMLALNSVNRLASTILLTGGITPMLAASLMGGFSWSQWLILMMVPYGVLLIFGAILIYILNRRGFIAPLSLIPMGRPQPLSGGEIRTAIITLGASLLWLTDALHHWNPALPALLAWICLLAPRIGVLTWKDFERNFPWTNFFVLASSLSLAHALTSSGASAWIAGILVNGVTTFTQHPLMVVLMLLLASAPVRLLIPNISGFLAATIPIAMSIGASTGLNPIICGLVVMIAGDAVLYYPAQSASSLVVYERGHLTASEIFFFGLWMTLLAYLVILAIALPYWAMLGMPLRVISGG